MSHSLCGKIAIVTGGSKGIGRACATALVQAGAKVVINYLHNTAIASATVQQLGESNAIAVQADAGSLAGIDNILKAAVETWGRIDIVIPNAALVLMRGVENTSEEDWDRIYALNVKGPYFLVQKSLPYMAPGSRVVFVSTTQNTASTVSGPYTLYCSSKGAIDQMVRTMSKDLGAKGITVNGVAPGPTNTELFMEGKSEQAVDFLKSLNPFERLGQPDEVANVVLMLCSAESRWVNGQMVRVNGGMA